MITTACNYTRYKSATFLLQTQAGINQVFPTFIVREKAASESMRVFILRKISPLF